MNIIIVVKTNFWCSIRPCVGQQWAMAVWFRRLVSGPSHIEVLARQDIAQYSGGTVWTVPRRLCPHSWGGTGTFLSDEYLREFYQILMLFLDLLAMCIMVWPPPSISARMSRTPCQAISSMYCPQPFMILTRFCHGCVLLVHNSIR